MAARVLLLIGGDPAGHPFPHTSPLVCGILLSGGFELAMEANLERVKAGRVKEFDAVVLHGRFPWRDDPAEHGFESFVHDGKGLIVVHIASSSFEGSPRWRKLVGRVWEYGTSDHPPLGSFRVDIADPAHPITSGLPGFDLAEDERYHDLVVAPNATTHVLATATLAGRTEPMAWVLTPPEGGRVFHVTLGHNSSTYQHSTFQTLLNRGVTWAAGVPL